MFSRLLVPVDFSPSSDAALKTVRRHFPGAAVKLLHILSAQRIAKLYSDIAGIIWEQPQPA